MNVQGRPFVLHTVKIHQQEQCYVIIAYLINLTAGLFLTSEPWCEDHILHSTELLRVLCDVSVSKHQLKCLFSFWGFSFWIFMNFGWFTRSDFKQMGV